MIKAAFNAPLLVIVTGMVLSIFANFVGMPVPSSDSVSTFGQFGLAALVFSAAMQFRISRLAVQCPVSFRLCFGGAPLFLIACGIAAFSLIPQISLSAAFLLGGILMLNGSAFDRRAITNAPTPSLVKAGVHFESAVVMALGLPIVALLEGNATAPLQGQAVLAPLLSASIAVLTGFAVGGICGLIAAVAGNRFRRGSGFGLSVIAVIVAILLTMACAGNILVAAAATGLIWGEQSLASRVPRQRYRLRTEHIVLPLAFLLFGFVLAPRVLSADLLVLTFALAVVTVMRVAPRLIALQTSTLPRQAQVFLSWFGGTPGAASALYLLVMTGNSNLVNQEIILTVGTVCVLVGVFTARLTAKPLAQHYIRGMSLARKRAMFG